MFCSAVSVCVCDICWMSWCWTEMGTLVLVSKLHVLIVSFSCLFKLILSENSSGLIPHWSTLCSLLKVFLVKVVGLWCLNMCLWVCVCVWTAGLASRHTADPHPFHVAADARHGHPQPRPGRGARLAHGSPRPRQSAGFRLEVSLVWRDCASSRV